MVAGPAFQPGRTGPLAELLKCGRVPRASTDGAAVPGTGNARSARCAAQQERLSTVAIMADPRAFWTLSSFQLPGMSRDEMSAASQKVMCELAASDETSNSSVSTDGAGRFQVGTVFHAASADAAETCARGAVPALVAAAAGLEAEPDVLELEVVQLSRQA